METADKQATSIDDRRAYTGHGRQISYLATSALTPHPNNVRKHTGAQIRALAKSIEVFGFAAPILADKDGYILAGNARYLAAVSLGLTEVPVIFLPQRHCH
jgi:ParB-like chromosome segregation protein Spo0J